MRNINLAMIVVLAITTSTMAGILASANMGQANAQSKTGGSSSGVCLNNRYGRAVYPKFLIKTTSIRGTKITGNAETTSIINSYHIIALVNNWGDELSLEIVVVAFPSVIIASHVILAEFYSNLYSLMRE